MVITYEDEILPAFICDQLPCSVVEWVGHAFATTLKGQHFGEVVFEPQVLLKCFIILVDYHKQT